MYHKNDGATVDDGDNLDLVSPMWNLQKYSLNYSGTTESLCIYSKDEGTHFNAIANDFKSFEFKAKLLGNTEAQPSPKYANGILKVTTIAVPLKYLSNFWRLLEMPVINWKVELKLKWSKYSVLLPAGNDNVNDNDSENIIFTIKDTKLYVVVLTLSKLLSKGFERSIYWNQYKTKSQNKNTTNEYGYFLEAHFVRVNFIL